MLNTNLIHNCINILILVVCALPGFDFSTLGIDTETALKISSGLALLKLVINAVRDGPTGMVAPPPPAEEK